MTLLNDPASLPTPMWLVTRFLAASPARRQPLETLKSYLSPQSLLPPDKRESDTTFDWAVRTLAQLDFIMVENDDAAVADIATNLDSGDFSRFTDLLREQILDHERNGNIGDSGDQGGPKDLVRALAWFLTLDPFTPMSHDDIVQEQREALAGHLGKPLVNDVRWNRFGYWAPALGFAAAPLLGAPESQTLVPDCAVAVRRTARALWPSRTRLPAREFVTGILEALPVLPGGRFSISLGLTTDSPSVSPVLSFALLCGDEYGWLKLDRHSDSEAGIQLTDPDRATGMQWVTHVEILESIDG